MEENERAKKKEGKRERERENIERKGATER